MKKTEQRWLHKCSRRVLDKDEQFGASENYLPCTVTYDEPEWEEVEETCGMILFSEGKPLLCESKQQADKIAKTTTGVTCVIELRGTYRRRKPEPKPEVWEDEVQPHPLRAAGTVMVPQEWVGKRVEVRVLP